MGELFTFLLLLTLIAWPGGFKIPESLARAVRSRLHWAEIHNPHSAIIRVYRVAFEKEKELTDRALKLAEVGKPKSNWELQGVLGMAAFLLGFLAGK